MNTFGERLKELREQNKLNHMQLAFMLNVRSSVLIALEEGKAEPTKDIIDKLSENFGVSADYLLGKSI